MNFPRSILISLIVMISMGVVAIALVPQRGRDAAILHVPQVSDVIERNVFVEHTPAIQIGMDITGAVATFSSENYTMLLLKTSSSACENLMGRGWLESSIGRWGEGDDVNNVQMSHACWHQYKNFEPTWDGAHYERSLVAICALIDGHRYDGCVNMWSDVFEWR